MSGPLWTFATCSLVTLQHMYGTCFGKFVFFQVSSPALDHEDTRIHCGQNKDHENVEIQPSFFDFSETQKSNFFLDFIISASWAQTNRQRPQGFTQFIRVQDCQQQLLGSLESSGIHCIVGIVFWAISKCQSIWCKI